jgi:L-fuculose-phosphate aldolase
VNVDDARRAVRDACLRMVADGLVIGSAGNISARVDPDRFVVSAADVPYAVLTADDFPMVEIHDGSWHGSHRPTSELALHLGIMPAMPEV